MKKLLFVVAALMVLGLAIPANAQDENRFSVYGGYYFVHSNISVNGSGTTTITVSPELTSGNSSLGFNFNGGGGQFAYNLNQDRKIKFGVVADFADYRTSSHGGNFGIFNYLFGPRISFGDGRLQNYVQMLFGGARASGSGLSENTFAMTAGWGVDFQVTKHFFVRPAQVEYMLTKFNGFGATGNSQNSLRYSAGVGYRWP